MTFTCPVCGFPGLTERPRDPDSGPSYEICPSCGYQFGFDDDSEGIAYRTWRERWRTQGMPWFSSNPAPAGWDPVEQLRALESAGSQPGGMERGASTIEYVGMLIFAAIVVVALLGAAPNVAGQITSRVSSAVASLLGTGAGATSAGSPPGTSSGLGTQSGAGASAPPGGGGGAGGASPPGAAGGSAAGGPQSGSPNPLNNVQNAALNSARLSAAGGNVWGNPSTLTDHFNRHGGDFGSPSEGAYANEAQQFLQRAVGEHLPTKVGPDGTIRVYDPATNTFGSYNPDGSTKTYFKPDLTKNPNYWGDQKGIDPWNRSGGAQPGSGGGKGGGSGSGGKPGGSGGAGSGSRPGGGGAPPPKCCRS